MLLMKSSMRIALSTILPLLLLQCTPFYAALFQKNDESDALLALLAPASVATGAGGSGELPALQVFLTDSQPSGSMQNGGIGFCDGSATAVERADCYCMLDTANPDPISGPVFKALISGSGRSATSNANCSPDCAGRSDWVLQPNRRYVDTGANTVFITDSNSIFDVTSASELVGSLTHGASSAEYWSGLSADWTQSSTNCSGWSDGVTGNGSVGQPDTFGATFLFLANDRACQNTYGSGSTRVARLFCVAQPL